MEKLLLKKEGSELVRRILVYVVLNSFHLKMTPAQLRPTHVAVSPTHLMAVCGVSPPLGWQAEDVALGVATTHLMAVCWVSPPLEGVAG